MKAKIMNINENEPMRYNLGRNSRDVFYASVETDDRLDNHSTAIVNNPKTGIITITAKDNTGQVKIELTLPEIEQLHLHCMGTHKRRMELERLRVEEAQI